MRSILLLLAFVPTLLLGQKTVTLNGQVDAAVTRVVLDLDFLHLDDPAMEKVVPVHNGSFSVAFRTEGPEIIELTAEKRKFYLFTQPGANIEVQLSGTDYDSKVLALGDLNSENGYFLAFQDEYQSFLDGKRMEGKVKGAAIDLLELDLYDTRKKMQKGLKEARKKKDLDADFAQFMEHHIDYLYGRWLLAYPIVRANANAKSMDVKALPRTIEQGLEAPASDQPLALLSPHFREYVNYYVTYFNSKDNGFKKYEDYNKNVLAKAEKAENSLSGDVKTWYLANLCFNWCEKIAPGTMEELRGSVSEGKSGKKYNEVLEAKCATALEAREAQAKAQEKSSKGDKNSKPPKDETYPIRLVDLNGEPVHLSQYKGKVVYIDFWASWCGPCRRQFPYSKKLHADLEDRLGKKGMKDLVFLYVSIDKSEPAWKNAVEQFSLKGVQVRSAPQWPDGAAAYFKINGIPRYMIMNKEGKIVQSNAKRPSMEGIADDLVNLL